MEPAPELRGFISSYYIFWADLPKVTDVVRADLPQLRFMLAGKGDYSFANGHSVSTPEISLIGPTMGASHFAVTGPLLVFGVAMLPAGWAALVRDDASRHADGIEDATAIFGPLLRDGLDAMRMAPSFDVMASVADAVFRAFVDGAADAPLWFTGMTDAWLTGAASPEVDVLVAEAGMSARQIERLARRIYGAPPKLLARKYRALRAASVLGSAHLSWQEVAGDAFYDQSHFIREIKHFTGLTPRQFQRDMPPVTRLSLQRRALTGRLPELALVS
jgi:AraC-like DNA-binding protein